MNQERVIQSALKALREYDQLGYISDHRSIMRELLLALPDSDKTHELLEISSILMIKTIEKARKGIQND